MFRISVIGKLMLVILLLLSACEGGKSEDVSAAQSEKAGEDGVAQINSWLSDAALRSSLEEARGQIMASQLELEKSLLRVQAALDRIDSRESGAQTQVQAIVKKIAPALVEKATEKSTEKPTEVAEEAEEGWSWWSKSFLLLLMLGGFFALYHYFMREDDGEEDDFMDDEFLEENELGTVRYPGSGSGKRKG